MVKKFICIHLFHDFLSAVYRSGAKLVLSAANDGYIVAWASGGGVYDRIQVSAASSAVHSIQPSVQ